MDASPGRIGSEKENAMRRSGSSWPAAALVKPGARRGSNTTSTRARSCSSRSPIPLPTLAPTNARRLFVLDTAFPAAEAAKTYVLNGTTGAIEGMFNQAYWPNFAVSPDGTELYAVDYLLGEAHPRQAQRLHRGARCTHAWMSRRTFRCRPGGC